MGKAINYADQIRLEHSTKIPEIYIYYIIYA